MTKKLTTAALLLLDVAAAIAVFNLIGLARGVLPGGHPIVAALIVPAAAFTAAIYLVQGYSFRTDMLAVDYASQHAIATMGAMIGTLLLTYVIFPAGYELQSSRFVIALSFVALIPLTLGYRRLWYLRILATSESRTIIFVGDNLSCETFDLEYGRSGMSQPVVYARRVSEPADAAAIDPLASVLTEIEQNPASVEAIVLRESARDLAAELSDKLVRLYFAGVPTYTLELFHELYWQKIPLYRLNQTWLFQEGFKIAREPVYERAKRATDIVLASVGLLVSLPFLVIAAAVIRIGDSGPAVFRQTRIGRNHVPFIAYKLRTMRSIPNGERYTRPGDTRITRIGRFLRATRLDEVPQLWNVLRGDMSMIGPRAEWDRLVEEYEKQIPCYHFRHLVRPGITGWAQVNYPYGASVEDTLRKLEYDLYYIRHFSFRLDATIVMKTIHVMLFGKGR